MKKSMGILITIVLIIVVLIFGAMGSYNGLVSLDEEVKTAFSQIDNQLQRRNDLIPNLVATVKQYAAHEEEIFIGVSEARAKLSGATTVADQANADAELTTALSRLLAISENYPELKANQNFTQLQDELAGTENRISVARKDYNDTAKKFNTKVRRFPTVLFARMLGFDPVDYFEASQGARENPNVGDLFD